MCIRDRTTVNGYTPDVAQKRTSFEDLVPIFPNERLRLERPGASVAMRVVDLISPIGKGQRGMVVSQPKADVYKRQCLFGCGGNRAKSRRYEMGEVSSRLADLTVAVSYTHLDVYKRQVVTDGHMISVSVD